jgi:hypothetical protein
LDHTSVSAHVVPLSTHLVDGGYEKVSVMLLGWAFVGNK